MTDPVIFDMFELEEERKKHDQLLAGAEALEADYALEKLMCDLVK